MITTSKGLKKPELTDNADLTVFVGENMETINTELEDVDSHKNSSEIHRKITSGTSTPSGGVDGDLYFQYE